MKFIKRNQLLLFFSVFALLQFLQAAISQMWNDEDYYWVYSKFSSWGYFDHPPMIALLIKGGYFLFKNEFGVRLFVVVLNILTVIIIYRLLPQKNNKIFFAIIASAAALQVAGFLAVPDTPLLFFTAVFFVYYKRFLKNASLLNSTLLGVVMALMLYSKYQGVLVIFFTIISNPHLIKKPKAYLAAVLALVLFIPHLYWQYTHGFSSFRYHLFERNADAYSISFTADYLGGQMLLTGPVIGWLLLWASYKYKTKDLFERALKFCLLGILGFFLFSTIKGHVELNWTLPIIVPLIILGHQYLISKKNLQKILYYSLPVSAIVILFLRYYLAFPVQGLEVHEFHKNIAWSNYISSAAKGLPVVFTNSYQRPSKYWFYSGNEAFSLSTPFSRRNNYNFWNIEKDFRGKSVYIISDERDSVFTDSVITPAMGVWDKRLWGKRIDSFYSFSNIQFNLPLTIRYNKQLYNLNVRFRTTQIDEWNRYVKIFHQETSNANLFIFKKNNFIGKYPIDMIFISNSDNFTCILHEPLPLEKGTYSIKIGLKTSIQNLYSLNSPTAKLIVL